MSTVHLRRRMPALDVVASVLLGLGAVVLGAMAHGGAVGQPFLDEFGRGELLGWCLLALATGGLVFGARDRRPPLLASGLVGSAALLGAGPVACALIGVAGALGGLRRLPGLAAARVLGAAVLGWGVPGVLGLAAGLGGPGLELGGDQALPVAGIVALWIAFAVLVPLIESVTSHVVLPAAERVDPLHVIRRRLEPQSVLAALAVLAAITYGAVGPAGAFIVLVPAAAASVGFRLHDDGRRAVSQTLAAMTVLPEWVGMVESGHTARVRAVAERVALDLGLESRLRRDVVRAAALHELGHLDGGVVSGDRGRIARSGAAVLEQAGVPDRLARIIMATDPERVVDAVDEDVELGATIVSAACELDTTGAVLDELEAARRVQLEVVARRRRVTTPA